MRAIPSVVTIDAERLRGLHVEFWPIERLIPYARNARTHSEDQVAHIAASIVEFGWTNPILAGADGVIIAGHARLAAARKLKMTEVPVIVLDHLNEAQRRALVLADNKLALNAGWDEEMLRVEMEALKEADFDLDVTGFSDEELEEIFRVGEEPREGLTDDDAAPELPEQAITAPGDLWRLGEHRLLCGDATKLEAAELVMAGGRADLIWTDPPYNVDYEGYTPAKLTIKGDRMSPDEYHAFLAASLVVYRAIAKKTASIFVCYADRWQREVLNACEAAGFALRCTIIWAKHTFAWGFGRYKFQHEAIFHGHVAGESDHWYGEKNESTLWQEKKPNASRLHPTMKPVELIERALRNHTKPGEVVADFFGGSGSTLIACEKMGRRARLIELDPKYCDVIISRWQEWTGEQARHETSGRSFEDLRSQMEEVAHLMSHE